MSRFAAIDFETANQSRDSACAVGVVFVTNGRIVRREHHLIRPPSRQFVFSYIHGLTWNDVRNKPTFGELWPELSSRIEAQDFIAAHNAPFDRGVLRACCATYSMPEAQSPFVCTVSVARKQWAIRPAKLPDVCQHLDIDLRHHEAISDAEACARIVLAAEQNGWRHE